MKSSFVALVAVLAFAQASHASSCEKEIRVTGAAAAEMYSELNLPETQVQDEHGGQAFAVAKYGQKIGCQKDLEGSSVECWVVQESSCR